jgi:hypothetical protein
MFYYILDGCGSGDIGTADPSSHTANTGVTTGMLHMIIYDGWSSYKFSCSKPNMFSLFIVLWYHYISRWFNFRVFHGRE